MLLPSIDGLFLGYSGTRKGGEDVFGGLFSISGVDFGGEVPHFCSDSGDDFLVRSVGWQVTGAWAWTAIAC